ncbi:MAG: 1,4-dihydroxy-6-naphtoate synthase [Elusimicrobia bacterium]|nr:1,4-dihydroxy-6-naphtoate synthase [Elusimicrobiota bacterium]
MTTPSMSSETKLLRIGHTPDPDDAYMFYGFASGKVTIPGYAIENVLEDIESLNKKAMKSEIEVTAISTAVYPLLQNNYWIMPTGASVGRRYGPIVVRRVGNPNPKTKKIGIPGKNTTAYLLLRLYCSAYQPVEMRFDQIPQAIIRGEVDYGLLIHEAQLTYESLGLEKITDLGVEWFNDTHLPIPLGLDVVRKDLGHDQALLIWKGLKESIEAANQDKDNAVQFALKYGRGLQKGLGEKFVGMYVNADTLELGAEGENALNLLFDRAYRAGIYSKPTIVDILRP